MFVAGLIIFALWQCSFKHTIMSLICSCASADCPIHIFVAAPNPTAEERYQSAQALLTRANASEGAERALLIKRATNQMKRMSKSWVNVGKRRRRARTGDGH